VLSVLFYKFVSVHMGSCTSGNIRVVASDAVGEDGPYEPTKKTLVYIYIYIFKQCLDPIETFSSTLCSVNEVKLIVVLVTEICTHPPSEPGSEVQSVGGHSYPEPNFHLFSPTPIGKWEP
jgi:hypothetical protein